MKFFLILILFPFLSFAQETQTGPILDNFGSVYYVETPDLIIDKNENLFAVFDIGTTPENLNDINPLINSLARYLNLHGQAGINKERLKVAFVIHGSAVKDILDNKSYQKRHHIDNPNEKLLKALHKVGVEMFVCGQSLAYHKVHKAELLPEIKVANSAMTALVILQNNGYRLIKF